MSSHLNSEQTHHYPVYVGTAGWSLPRDYATDFPEDGTHLERYSRRLCGAEINSSFYRPHLSSTYARWASSVPENFRLGVKVPKEITHRLKLIDAIVPLEKFLAEASGLANTLGPLLVQLPPSLAFDDNVAGTFFSTIRERFSGGVVCEPRHASWFSEEAGSALTEFQIARVAADPAVVPAAAAPGGWRGLVYYRLHGSPRRYYSAYPDEFLDKLVHNLHQSSRSGPTWCIFDNTASGAAIGNALMAASKLADIVNSRR